MLQEDGRPGLPATFEDRVSSLPRACHSDVLSGQDALD